MLSSIFALNDIDLLSSFESLNGYMYPFKDSNEERRSISFNAKIDDNIYNVYGG